MAIVLIAGCGDTGSALARLLLQAEHEVWGLRRDVDALPPGVRALRADLGRPETLTAVRRAWDFVFYTAAASIRTEKGYRETYVHGLTHILGELAACKTQPKRLFFTSSTSVYGQMDGAWVDERSATLPSGFSGRIMLEAEGVLKNAILPATAVRLAGIYGPGRDRMLRLARNGLPNPTTAKQFTNRIHRDDCARLLAFLMDHSQPAPLYLGVDDEPAAYHEVLSWLCGRMGITRPAPDGAATIGRGSNKRCSNHRIKRAGFTFRYPSFREGYEAMLDAFLKTPSPD